MDEMSKNYPLTPPGMMMPPGMMIPPDNMIGDRPDSDMADIRLPLAMAYVPRQSFGDIYDDDKGLIRGTVFRELDLPFKGGKR